MTWETYGSFLALAAVLVVVPGPDFAVVTRNVLAGGRRRGAWTAAGIATSNAVQGSVAAAGLGAVIAASQPLFEAVRWAGVAYLAFLGIQALHAAVRGHHPDAGAERRQADRGAALAGWRQGLVSNITNPKVLVFYLAVLPQFLTPGAGLLQALPLAYSHALLSLAYLLLLVTGMHRAGRVLRRRRVRRALDAGTGVALLCFGARLAREQA